MIKKRYLFTIIPLVFLIGLVVFPAFGLCKTRKQYTVDFIMSTEDDVWKSFSEYDRFTDSDNEIETLETTRAGIGGLYLMDEVDQVDSEMVKVWIRDRTSWAIDLNDNLENASFGIEGLYYLDLIDYYGRKNDFIQFSMNFSEIYGSSIGYALTLETNASVAGTYHVVKSIYHLNAMDDIDVSNITEFVENLLNTDGGFKYSPSATESSLSATYYAIQTLNYLDALTDFQNKSLVKTYVDNFYVDDTTLTAHYGGFSHLIESETPFTTVIATFEAVSTLYSMGFTSPDQEATKNWILNTQNIEDGGFAENLLSGNQQRSSTITTYYALNALNLIDPGLIVLSEEFGDYKLRWWIVLIVVLVVIGAGITGYILYERRIKL